MTDSLMIAGVLAIAAIVSMAITSLFLKAVKLLIKTIVFIVVFGAVAFLLMHFLG